VTIWPSTEADRAGAHAPPALDRSSHDLSAASTWARLRDLLWYGRSVRAQLLVAFVGIGVAAALIAGSVTILQARTSTRLEIAASLRMAEILVGETAELLQQQVPAEQFLANLPSQLRFVRHLRVAVRDASGHLVPVRPDAAEAPKDERSPAPAWFAALIAPPVVTREVPVLVKGQRMGSVLITSEPSDEIAEVWENTVDFALVCLLVGLAAIGALHVLLGRVLDPLTGVSAGLADLERRNYRVRLDRPQVLELAAIIDRFNALAEALDALRRENERLNRRLITAQDDERRRTALELHDEVGPSLFGLKANAASIANATGAASESLLDGLRQRAGEMLAIIEHLQAVNRSMLNRLRPMALGHVPLAELVSEVVRERARQQPDISFAFSPGKLSPSYGDSIDLTIYRCVQEGLTNVIRHARATRADIELTATDGAHDGDAISRLALVLRDDGRGIDPSARLGRGLLGMQERLQGLGGACAIEQGRGGGTVLRITIPLPTHLHDGAETRTLAG
jgi:two-component system, NarL family, sensor histidine kinase UhpB